MGKIQEIVEESENGDYIYRGEPEQYKEHPYCGKVSSNLYREHEKEIEADSFDIKVVQQEILNEAKEYLGETSNDFEILTELQHLGGKTNLIDFTTDYLIALFFACDGSHDEPGRIILLENQSEAYEVIKPTKIINRVTSQKSIFVQPGTGFIDPTQYKVICIPEDLKTHVLDYLQKHHDISTKTIYNDLQGFVENRRIHRSAYTEFYRGLTCQERGNIAETLKEKHEHYENAVKHYTEALKLNPQMLEAYHNRGIVYSNKGEYDEALQAFSTAIEIKPDYTKAYYNRGVAYLKKGEYDEALQAFSRVIELDPDYADAYYYRGLAYHIKDEPDEALQAFSRVIELDPDYADACYYRGIAYHMKDEYDEALQDYNTAIKIKPDYVDAYNARGAAYSKKGEFGLGIDDFSRALKLNPDDGNIYCHRGEAWLHLKEWEKAKSDLTVARNMGVDIIASFHNDYESVADFEEENDVQLPEDIAAMLRRQ